VALGLLVFWLMMATLVAAIAANKGRNWFGFFVYGFLLWPLALVHALVMRSEISMPDPDLRPCPHCAEPIKRQAKVCKHCARDIIPPDRRPCPHCGVMNDTGKLICGNCRKHVPPWSIPA
jgi:hypothetical protein